MEEEKQIVKATSMSMEETQLAEQLYNSAGLGPVVEAGLKDYDARLRQENKWINKVLGPRESDIQGYGEAVAKRVAYAVYMLLNQQYGGRMGDLRGYIRSLEEERNHANARYDELMGRVVGILGKEYEQLRIDSKEFMEKLTSTLGEDLQASKIDHKALAESLADIDGLRGQVETLSQQNAEQKAAYEAQLETQQESYQRQLEEQRQYFQAQIETLKGEYEERLQGLNSRIQEMEAKIDTLEGEKAALTQDLTRLQEGHNRLKEAATGLIQAIPHEEVGRSLSEGLYNFILQDAKVPDVVIKGVGQFINLRRYLEYAAVRGSQEGVRQAEERLRQASTE